MDDRKLQAIIDQQEIRDVEARYCEAIDEYDLETVLACFTTDCVTDYGAGRGGSQVGREAMRQRWESSTGGPKHTHHQLGQVRVELKGDEAECIAYCTADHEKKDGKRITMRYQYRDRLRRTSAGWLISHRRLLFTINDNDPGLEREWLKLKKERP